MSAVELAPIPSHAMTSGAALLVAASGAVVLASALFVWLDRPRGVVAALLAVGLVAWTSIDVIVGVAGLAMRSFAPSALLALAVVELAVAGLVVVRFGAGRSSLARFRNGLPAVMEALSWPPTAIAAVLVGAMLVWRSVLAVRLPVVDYLGWQYHLVTVDVWLQANQLVRVSQNFWTDGWPAGGELLTTWLAAFTRSDALTGFSGLVPIPLAALAVTGLARALGAGRRAALLAGLLFAMLPVVVVAAGTTYPDTASAAAVIAGWFLGLRLLRGESGASPAVQFGMATGLAIGTKDTNVFLLIPVVIAVAVHLTVDARRAARDQGRPGVLSQLLRGSLAFLPLLVLGGSWYLKNLVLHGNPLFPVRFGPFAGPIGPGSFGVPPIPASLASAAKPIQIATSWASDWHLSRYEYHVPLGGFGLSWLPIVVLAGIGLAILLRRRQFAAAVVVVGVAAVALAVIPSPWYARYTLFVPAVGLALAALAIDRLRRRDGTLVGMAVVALAAVSLTFANARPNIRLPTTSTGVRSYVAFVLAAPDQRRLDVDLRRECAAFEVIPAGGRVAVAERYEVPHAAVGPDLQRELTDPIVEIGVARELVDAMRSRMAGWLVTTSADPTTAAAVADPADFLPMGPVCRHGLLFQFRPGQAGR